MKAFMPPHLVFNGNCAKAIELCEEAFGIKAEIMTVNDKSCIGEKRRQVDNFVAHAELGFVYGRLCLADVTEENGKCDFGNGDISVSMSHASSEIVKAVLKTIKVRIGSDLSKLFGTAVFAPLRTSSVSINR